MPPFPAAGVAEILRSAQKDEVYSEQLGRDISELSLEVLGPRTWLRWKAYIEATAAFAYLSATTLCDFQTLGEEYAGLLQVHQANLPSKFRRLISLALYCFGPLGMSSAIGSLKRRVAEVEDVRGETKDTIGIALETAQAVLPQVHRLNISAFFLGSAFYHLSKRLTGIEYVKVGAFGERDGGLAAAPSFRLLGAVSLINVVAAICHTVWTRWKSARVPKSASDRWMEKAQSPQSPASVRSCVLCLDAMRSPSCCSTCGHTFCWACIMESLSVNAECPLCRVRTEPRQVVALMNYE